MSVFQSGITCLRNRSTVAFRTNLDGVRFVLLVTLPLELNCQIQEGMKRTVQVNVKMTQDDFDLLRKAAEKRWPDAVMTNSGIVLALAKIAARDTLAMKRRQFFVNVHSGLSTANVCVSKHRTLFQQTGDCRKPRPSTDGAVESVVCRGIFGMVF